MEGLDLWKMLSNCGESPVDLSMKTCQCPSTPDQNHDNEVKPDLQDTASQVRSPIVIIPDDEVKCEDPNSSAALNNQDTELSGSQVDDHDDRSKLQIDVGFETTATSSCSMDILIMSPTVIQPDKSSEEQQLIAETSANEHGLIRHQGHDPLDFTQVPSQLDFRSAMSSHLELQTQVPSQLNFQNEMLSQVVRQSETSSQMNIAHELKILKSQMQEMNKVITESMTLKEARELPSNREDTTCNSDNDEVNEVAEYDSDEPAGKKPRLDEASFLETEQLKDQIESLRKKLTENETKLKKAEAQCTMEDRKRNMVEITLSVSETERKIVEDKLSAITTKLQDAEAQRDQGDVANNELKKRLKSLETKLKATTTRQKNTVNNLEKRKKVLGSEKQSLSAKLKDIEGDRKVLQETVATIETQLDESNIETVRQKEAAEKREKILNSEKITLGAKVKELRDDKRLLMVRVEKMEIQLHGKNIERLEQSLCNRVQELDAKETELARRDSDLKELSIKLKQSESQLQAEKKMARMAEASRKFFEIHCEKKLNATQSELDSTRDELEKTESEREILLENLRELKLKSDSLQHVQDAMNKLRENFHLQEKNLKSTEFNLTALRSALKMRETQINNLEEEKSSLRAKLTAVEHKFAEADLQISKFEEVKSSLRAKLRQEINMINKFEEVKSGLTVKLASTEAKLTKTNQQLTELEKMKSTLRAKLVFSNARLRVSEVGLKQTKTEMKENEECLKVKVHMLKVTTDNLNEAKSILKLKQSELKSAEIKILEHLSNEESLKKSITSERSELLGTQNTLRAMESEFEMCKQDQLQREAELEEARSKIDTLEEFIKWRQERPERSSSHNSRDRSSSSPNSRDLHSSSSNSRDLRSSSPNSRDRRSYSPNSRDRRGYSDKSRDTRLYRSSSTNSPNNFRNEYYRQHGQPYKQSSREVRHTMAAVRKFQSEKSSNEDLEHRLRKMSQTGQYDLTFD